MGFKNAMNKVKRTLLCCRKEKKKPLLKIGPTTDVRRMDITEGMPDLTEADAKLIQEKAVNDAYRLLSSNPTPKPTRNALTDPFASTSALPIPTDPFASASASAAASQTNLPVPSPGSVRSQARPLLDSAPSPTQNGSPSTLRTAPQKIWEKTRRLSGLSRRSSHRSSALYSGLERGTNKRDEPLIIELDARGKDMEGDDTKSGASVRGFEVVDTVGGTPEGTPTKKRGGGVGGSASKRRVVSNPLIEKAVNATEDDSSEDEEVERRPLVKA
ncbi:uncharacterized protein N0V89_007857 [Didymosphaeria variabile]|uniref:Uncharacterized protein n=1 Tax=Didymosphaeria variabile TaxID=1932322 RepID=A0A9W9CAP7_9PLEO|nr:uncharacterized protein N0V89_007857 [Didymosphaeria variabile]KAJ4352508.1 hypothetical protein N0V89_007857 [Didymosphaeria variabile]